jgi:hypothetical protein
MSACVLCGLALLRGHLASLLPTAEQQQQQLNASRQQEQQVTEQQRMMQRGRQLWYCLASVWVVAAAAVAKLQL